MVSEGVDIPRLRVGVYRDDRAHGSCFFRQVVGRFNPAARRRPSAR
jgi:superfamily II DNA or RNA helicase